MNKVNKSQVVKTIIKVLAGAAAVSALAIAPGLGALVGSSLKKKSKLKNAEYKSGLAYARQKGWVEVRETRGGNEILLTERGRKYWQKIELEKPIEQVAWDGKWRIVIFDIPNEYRNSRDNLRLGLKRLGFVQLQESVWIIPYQCGKEVATLSQIHGVKQFVRVIEAKSFDGDSEFRENFHL